MSRDDMDKPADPQPSASSALAPREDAGSEEASSEEASGEAPSVDLSSPRSREAGGVDLSSLLQAAQSIAGIKQILFQQPDGEAAAPGGATLLAAVELDRGLDSEARARALAELSSLVASCDHALECAVFDAAHWQRQAAGEDPGIALSLTPAPLRARELYRRWKAGADHPATARRRLRAILRAHARNADLLSSTQQLPAELCLGVLAQQLQDTLSLVYASKDAVFEPGPGAHRLYRELFADDAILQSQDLALLDRLRGLAAQVSIQAGLDGPVAPDSIDWPRRELARFYHRVERELLRRHTDARLRRRLRRQRVLVLAAVGLAGVLGCVAVLLHLRPEAPRMQPPEPVSAGGIEAVYYKDKNLKHESRRSVTAGISLNTRGAPVPELGVNNFSIRWQGFIRFARSGLQVVCGESDDGQRVYVNDKIIVDDWKNHSTQRHCGEIRTRAGWYPLRVEYYESGGNALMRLLSGPSKEAVKPVKASALCCGQVAGPVQKK